MALNFPNSPSDGDTYEGYVWNATVGAWQSTFTGGGGASSGNAIINGDFGVWQRGTTFTTLDNNVYFSDRWYVRHGSPVPSSRTVSREAFTAGDVEAIGYGAGEYFHRTTVVGTTGYIRVQQPIEDVGTFAGQTVTLSFWARSNDSTTLSAYLQQDFGSGGSALNSANLGTQTLTSSWQRFSFTHTFDSLAGKTVGTSSSVRLLIEAQDIADGDFDVWGVQLEAGSVATPFKLAGGGSKAAELALCQRYYFKFSSGGSNYTPYGPAFGRQNSNVQGMVSFPVEMRVPPTALETTGTASDYRVLYQNANEICTSVPTFTSASTLSARLIFSGSSVFTVGEGAMMVSDFSSSTSFLAWSAEL
jgi:hypothetical protein